MSTQKPGDGEKPSRTSQRRMRAFSPWQMPAASEQATAARVLVVDADAVSRRFVELALEARGGNAVPLLTESVKDVSGAFEVLRTMLVDLIVSETDLPDMNGLRFCRLLQQESRLRGIPFVFFATDSRVDTKVVALRAGVDDYVVKPCDAAELRARIQGLITRQRRIRAREHERSYTLGGDFSTLPLPDLISILELSRRTGVLSIITPRAVGDVLVESGQIVHASFGNLIGAEAFYRMMAEANGQFEFTPGALPPNTLRTVTDTVPSLLMEAARLLDHQDLAPSSRRPPSSLLRSPGSVRPPPIAIAEKPDEALRATPTLAAQFEIGISDEFALGELRLWNREELSRWTRGEGGRDRLHVHLIADLNEGVSALLTLASQASERWVVDALTPEEKALGLVFFLRYERLLDITLIDAQNPEAFLPSLNRCPALTILAPPQGNVLGIGPKALVELNNVLRRVPPLALLWVARADIDSSLSSMLSLPPVECVRAALGDGELDLRALLVRGVRHWLSQTAPAVPQKIQRRPA